MRVEEMITLLQQEDQKRELVIGFDTYYKGEGYEEVDTPYQVIDEGVKKVCIGSIYSQP